MDYKHFILDVDGVLTDGKFFYTSEGKVMKAFGSDDFDALNLIKHRINIQFITGDKKGFAISSRRVTDMGFPITLVSTHKRIEWIKERYDLNEVIYMGDGIFDSLVFEEVGYGIAPANAFYVTLSNANFRTSQKGGEGAVASAVRHIVINIFKEQFYLKKLLKDKEQYEQNKV